jgi:hypothetical protein
MYYFKGEGYQIPIKFIGIVQGYSYEVAGMDARCHSAAAPWKDKYDSFGKRFNHA